MDFVTIVTTYGVATIAILAFVVSIITEVIKSIGPLKNVPTNAVVVVVSLIVTVLAYFGLVGYFEWIIAWYELAFAVVASFVVALIAMNGWEKFAEIWARFKK